MWKQLQALLPLPKPKQLTIDSYGQATCGLPFEQIQSVMEWLSLSLMAAGYQAKAHVIWDSQAAGVNLADVLKKNLHDEPTFLYRCGASPMPPPAGYYWRLLPEYPTLRMYQLERKVEWWMLFCGRLSNVTDLVLTSETQKLERSRLVGLAVKNVRMATGVGVGVGDLWLWLGGKAEGC